MAAAFKLQPLNTADNSELRFASFAEAGEHWLQFANQVQGATLYHRKSWLNLLRAAFGIEIQIAMLERGSEPMAGCLFARSGRPFARRFVSLPDSELCTPLARDSEAAASLLRALAAHPVTRAGFEIHGVEAAPQPWQTVDIFAQWSIDLQQSVEKLHKALDRDVRRNMRHATEAGITVTHGDSLEYMRRFYSLHLETRHRLGLPPRPFKYFGLLHQTFSSSEIDVWIASRGGADLAGLLMLQDGDTLYAKMNARSADCPNGANHLMFVNAMDEYAGRLRSWDLGRVDTRNRGLTDFKKRLGATAHPLVYAFLPRAPRNVSSEVLTGPAETLSQIWRRLPLWSTRMLGAVMYRYLV
jgi:hypothetical protein